MRVDAIIQVKRWQIEKWKCKNHHADKHFISYVTGRFKNLEPVYAIDQDNGNVSHNLFI